MRVILDQRTSEKGVSQEIISWCSIELRRCDKKYTKKCLSILTAWAIFDGLQLPEVTLYTLKRGSPARLTPSSNEQSNNRKDIYARNSNTRVNMPKTAAALHATRGANLRAKCAKKNFYEHRHANVSEKVQILSPRRNQLETRKRSVFVQRGRKTESFLLLLECRCPKNKYIKNTNKKKNYSPRGFYASPLRR